jgi:microcystin-dependent protein
MEVNSIMATLTNLLNNSRGGLVPPGSVVAFSANSAPTGYVKCNGAALSRTLYSDLFTAIGTTFGAGDGTTTFLVPDLRGEFIRGWDDARGTDSGRTFGSYQADDFAAHDHPIQVWYIYGWGQSEVPAASHFGWGGAQTRDEPISNRGGAETRPKNKALLYCIKF